MGHTNNSNRSQRGVTLRISFQKLGPVRLLKALFALLSRGIMKVLTARLRWRLILTAVILVLADIFGLINPFFKETSYALGASAELLPSSSQTVAERIKFDNVEQRFAIEAATPASSTDNPVFGKTSLAGLTAYKDATRGITVSDPSSHVNFTMTPQFELLSGRQDQDRIVYPLKGNDGFAVYTMRSTGLKEDIILTESDQNTRSFSHTLELDEGLEAKTEVDGSIGIYGNSLLSGEVTTGSDADATLLKKARKNADKNTLVFSIPAPIVTDGDGVSSDVKAKYSLVGDTLTVTATGLKNASYPLSIDPTIYVASSQQLMAGNDESNVDFDTDNKFLTQSELSGSIVKSWKETTDLPSARWGSGTVATGGYMYSVGGSTGSTLTRSVNWSKIDMNSHELTSANPGDGACDGWCTDAAYDLPDGREKFALVTYNNYLYVMGGYSPNCTASNGTGTNGFCHTIYIAKLGANGEPRLWHPTDDNSDNWSYWYRNPTNMPTPRILTKAVASGNHIYLVGGIDNNQNVTNTLGKISINPNGTLDTWDIAGYLPSARYDHDAVVYNDRLYLIGGASVSYGAPTNTVHFTKIRADGGIGGWEQTSSMAEGLRGGGGGFAATLDGQLYTSGGCRSIAGNGHCSGASTSSRFASINADGSLGKWRDSPGTLASARTGHTLTAWHGTLYALGGCTAQNTSTGACINIADTSYYGTIEDIGEMSFDYQTTASGTGSCTGTEAKNCHLPGSSHIGNLLATTVIANGYLYVIGGCTYGACTTTSGNTAYMKLLSTGELQRPATCPGGAYQGTGWCVDSVDPISGGVAAASPVVFNNTLYLVGGFSGTRNTDSIVRASLNTDGSLSKWTSQALSGVGANDVSYSFATARANSTDTDTHPGSLYIIGGCTTTLGAHCTAYTDAVFKCAIASEGAIADCSTSDQQQLGSITGASGAGLALHSGAVYGDYIYLVGGHAPGLNTINTVRYAKLSDDGNIVTTSGGWTVAEAQLSSPRQRAASYVNNGQLYVVGGYDDNAAAVASPTATYIDINPEDGSLGPAWHNSDVSLEARWGVSTVTANSYVYIIGGCTTGNPPVNCTARSDTIQAAALHHNTGGTPFDYTPAANTYSAGANRFGAGAAVYDGRIYVAGGCGGTASCGSTLNSVTYASISDTGAIGTWSNAANLPATRGFGKLLVGGSSLYFVGGQNNAGTAQSSVYYATPAADGTIASWGTAESGLPNARSNFGAAAWDNRIYIVGGQGTSGDCSNGICNTIYVSPDLSVGGDITDSWSTASPDFDVARSGSIAVANGNALYLIGGYDGTNYLSDVQYAAIDKSTGDTTSWSHSTSLPRPVAQGDGFSANGYLYISGGRSSDNKCEPATLITPIGASSSSGTPTGIGNWYQAPATYSGDRYGNSTIYHEGKTYIVGGADCRMNISGEYSTATANATYTVPAGIESITVKTWGGAGGSGGGSSGLTGGAGGGGGYVSARLPVTPGENLTVRVGGGGLPGNVSTQGGGGSAGGYSGIFRGTTQLLIAGGGGGGGGSRTTTHHGGHAGAGGCTSNPSACDGVDSGTNTGGDGGHQVIGGAGGTGNCNGQAGSYLQGGNGAYKQFTACGLGYSVNGGVNGGGFGANGFNAINGNNAGGGGGGGGYYGGGSGAAGSTGGGGGGGGGGSSFVTGAADSVTMTPGSGKQPGNASDPDRGTAGQANDGGANNSVGSAGMSGKTVIYDGILTYPTPAIVQGALQVQPQISKYSILFDMEADVFPNHWLINGNDGTDGTRWQIAYRSMANPEASVQCGNEAMNTWGASTKFADANLATPSLLRALNAASADTNCTRYFTFEVTMDSTRSASFPSLPASNPAISEIVLSMVTNPAKRLRHGRSFIGGLQSPIDTPYYGY